MQNYLKKLLKEQEDGFDEKLTKYDKDGGFIVYVEGFDCSDFDTDLMQLFIKSSTQAILNKMLKRLSKSGNKKTLF